MITPRELGSQPDKTVGQFMNTADMAALTSDLRSSHIALGGESGARETANLSYGSFSHNRNQTYTKKGAG